MRHFRLSQRRTQSSRLAEFGGRGMSFNICRGTLGSLAMFTAKRNASSRDSRFIDMRKLNANRAILVARQVHPVLYNLIYCTRRSAPVFFP